MKHIRVLFVTHTEAMQGANHSLLRLMLELREHYGVEPTVLMPRVHDSYAKNNLLKACQEHGIECYAYRFYWFKNMVRLVSYARCLSNIWFYARILFNMRGKQYDIIHSNGSVISLGALLSRVKKVPHVWHLREAGWLVFGMKSLLGKRYEKWVYKHGEVYIAISNAIKYYFSSVLPPEKIRVIYNGVLPPENFPKHKSHDGTVNFCMVGILSSGKNQMEALMATDKLVNEWGEKRLHLTFIGHKEKVYTQKVQSFIDSHQLNEYVSLLGERNDVNKLLSQMDVGLMLSAFEGFGRVTVEYMMMRLAVIANDKGANQEIIENGKSGIIYGHDDYVALARAMKNLIDNDMLKNELAKNGRERAMKCFPSFKNTQHVYEVYLSLSSLFS